MSFLLSEQKEQQKRSLGPQIMENVVLWKYIKQPDAIDTGKTERQIHTTSTPAHHQETREDRNWDQDQKTFQRHNRQNHCLSSFRLVKWKHPKVVVFFALFLCVYRFQSISFKSQKSPLQQLYTHTQTLCQQQSNVQISGLEMYANECIFIHRKMLI